MAVVERNELGLSRDGIPRASRDILIVFLVEVIWNCVARFVDSFNIAGKILKRIDIIDVKSIVYSFGWGDVSRVKN